jgi:RNA polymerase sigma-70 factor, ECF subfamily
MSISAATPLAGDERAFHDVVEPFRRALLLHCYRMLGSPADAEDAVQETFLRAWRGRARFQGRSSVQTWLFRIATNACLDELDRARGPRAVLPMPDEHAEPPAPPTSDPAARYALHEGMELAFLTAIQQLPGRQRAVLILRDVLGWSPDEAAELLGTSVAGANSALQRARATLEREGVAAHSPAPHAPTQRDLLRRYVDAWDRADVGALVALLREDAELRMPPQPSVVGGAEVARFLGDRTNGCTGQLVLRPAWANGRPAVVMYRQDAGGLVPHGVLLLQVEGERIAGIDTYFDQEVVAAFTRAA